MIPSELGLSRRQWHPTAKPGGPKPSAWRRFPWPPPGRAMLLTRTGSVYLDTASASASALKGQAGFLGIKDQTLGALFSPSPPSFPPQEQRKRKICWKPPPPTRSPPPPPSPSAFTDLKKNKIHSRNRDGCGANSNQKMLKDVLMT